MQESNELEAQLRMSLQSMAEYLSKNNWRGREREVVSLFAFGFLAPNCIPGRRLHHPGQIGLDVAVPQLPGELRKKLVCKDLVLWSKPFTTCWNNNNKETNNLIAIMEWKARTDIISRRDEEWLLEYSRRYDGVTGFAVSIKPNGPFTRLVVNKTYGGVLTKDWYIFNNEAV